MADDFVDLRNNEILFLDKKTDQLNLFVDLLQSYLKKNGFDLQKSFVEDDQSLIFNILSVRNHKVLLLDKLLEKDKKKFAQKKILFIEIPALFKWQDYFLPLSKLLDISVKNNRSKIFSDISFTDLDEIILLYKMQFFVQDSNINDFEIIFKKFFYQESFFKITHFLFNKPSVQDFFTFWKKIKSQYPLQFWTIFFMNKIWKIMIEKSTKNQKSLLNFYEQIYRVDFLSKNVSYDLLLEPIFADYFRSIDI